MASDSLPENLRNERPRVRALRLLRQWVDDGVLSPGEPLPPEQTLADRLEISRTTVRAALEVLREEGLVEETVGPRRRRVASRETAPLMANTMAILADSGLLQYCRNWLYPRWSVDVACRVTDALYDRGYHTIRLNPRQFGRVQAERLLAAAPCGLVVLDGPGRSKSEQQIVDRFLDRNVPVAIFSEERVPAAASAVTPDFFHGTAELTRWLLARGRRRILPCWVHAVGQSPPAACDRRYAGYREVMAAAGEAPLPACHCALPAGAGGSATEFDAGAHMAAGHLVRHLADGDGIDAIITVSDCAARLLAAAALVLGRRPREDLDLAGFGRCPGNCGGDAVLQPSVSLKLDTQSLAGKLIDLVAQPPPTPTHHLVAPELVVSDS